MAVVELEEVVVVVYCNERRFSMSQAEEDDG